MGEAVLTRVAEGVWIDTEPVRVLGLRFTTTMTVLRLPDGGLVLVSPIRLTPERRDAVESLGEVAHLYAPNTWHHRWVGDWAKTFGDARVHAPAGLQKKRRDLRIDRVAGGEPEPAFDGVIDEVRVAAGSTGHGLEVACSTRGTGAASSHPDEDQSISAQMR